MQRLSSARSSAAEFSAISEIVHEELDAAVLFLITSQVLVMDTSEAQQQTTRLAFLQPWMKLHMQPSKTLRLMASKLLSRPARESLHICITDQVISSHPNMQSDKNQQNLKADLHELSDKWFAGLTGRVSWYVASDGVDIALCLPLDSSASDPVLGDTSLSMRLTRPLIKGELNFSPEFVACVTALLEFLREIGEPDYTSQAQAQAQQSYVYVYVMWFFMLRSAGACYDFDGGSWVVGPHKRAVGWMELYASDKMDLVVEGQSVLHYLACSRCSPASKPSADPVQDSTCLEEVCVVLSIATQLLKADPRTRSEDQPRLAISQILFRRSIFGPAYEQQQQQQGLDKLTATVLLMWIVRICPSVLDAARETEEEIVTTLLSELLHSPHLTRACLGLIMQASAGAGDTLSILPALVGVSSAPPTAAPEPKPQPVSTKTVPNIGSMQKELAELKQMQKNMGSIIVALNEKVQSQSKRAK